MGNHLISGCQDFLPKKIIIEPKKSKTNYYQRKFEKLLAAESAKKSQPAPTITNEETIHSDFLRKKTKGSSEKAIVENKSENTTKKKQETVEKKSSRKKN